MAIIQWQRMGKFALFFLSLICFHSLIAQEEKLFCPFDGREWKIGFQEYASDQSIVEMILEGQDILDWKELFTVQKFDGISLSADEFAKMLKQAFKDNLSANQDLVLRDLGPKELNIFESSFVLKKDQKNDSTIGNQEYNIGRILKGRTALYFVRYSAKEQEVFEKRSKEWLERLQQAYLADKPRSDQQGQWIVFTDKEVYQGDKKLSYENNGRTVTNMSAGYHLSLPRDWLLEETNVQETEFDDQYTYNVSLIFSDPNKDIYGGIAIHEKEESDQPLKGLLRKHYVSAVKEKNQEVKVTGKGSVRTILGDEGLYVVLKEKEEMGWIAFFENSNYAIRLELWGPANEEKELKANFDKLVTNLQILHQQSSEENNKKKEEEKV
jgi:hypothetical protein